MKTNLYRKIQKRTFEIIQKGKAKDKLSKIFDIFIMSLIFLNVLSIYIETMNIKPTTRSILSTFETISVYIFTVEYLLRLWTAPFLFPDFAPSKARIKYVFSFMALIDLLSVLPWYIPFFVTLDLRVLRSLRLTRLFRLFKFNRYTAALGKIFAVLRSKAIELISAVFVVFILMLISSILMYTVENPVQPEVFSNGFCGFWWAIATFTTVGYGDIYPITVAGRILGALISLLGIGFVAVPTAIISSGFMEQSAKTAKKDEKNKNEAIVEKEIHQGLRTSNSDSAIKKYSYCPYCGEKLS